MPRRERDRLVQEKQLGPTSAPHHRAPQVWYVHFYLAGALGLKGDLDGGRASLAEGLKLRPELNSVANFRDLRPYYSSPKALELEEHTVIDGLRRIGFSES